MSHKITFSRFKLVTFLACQRRFQLRFLQQLPWPTQPLSEQTERVLDRGQRFHQLAERHFQGLPAAAETIADDELRRRWLLFQQSGPEIPAGRQLPEISLTISVGRHLLTGRFDLLVVGETNGLSFAHIFDWKTGKAQEEAELKADWQTRLYLAMLARGSAAFLQDGTSIAPEDIAITYWYVSHPTEPVTVRYSPAWHEQNWLEIQELIGDIDQKLDVAEWPLTEDWSQCRRCAYQSYCGRQEAGMDEPEADEVGERMVEEDLALEPELP